MTPRELERQVAGLFSVGFAGLELDAALESLLDRGVAGVVLFARNVGTPAELAALVRDIKRRAGRPLLLSVDQEGGPVRRLRRGFTDLPSARLVGQTAEPELARELGLLVGRELAAVGIDVNFAPVLDIDTNPRNPVIGQRAYATTPEPVAEFGLAFARGLEQAGVAACGKHFPGHGDTDRDSHLDLPRLPHSLERLERVELAPFATAVRHGVPALMTAHVVFEAIESTLPATMSRKVIGELLRGRLGYEGLVISDDLAMKAISEHFELDDVIALGLNAGLDHFLSCHAAEASHLAIDAAIRALEQGRVPRDRLEHSVRRTAAFAARYARPAADGDLSVLDCEEHRRWVARIAERAAVRSGAG